MSKNLSYKGREIEIAKNQWGYILIIDGKDISYQHISRNDAELEAHQLIDAQAEDGR